MKITLILMSFFASLFSATAQQTEVITILEKEAFKAAIAGDSIQLVDVRTPQEYKAGYIQNAINIDYFDALNFSLKFEKLNKDKPIYLYCRSGSRSQKAANKLVEMGFKEIYDLKGGYMNWH